MSTTFNSEYERFVAKLPEDYQEECISRFTGSGLAPNNPIFSLLADIFDHFAKEAPEGNKASSTPDFLQEATLLSQMSKQTIADFQTMPAVILARLEKILAPLQTVSDPLNSLATISLDLKSSVSALQKMCPSSQPPTGFFRRLGWRLKLYLTAGRETLTHTSAWIVTGSICSALAVIVTVMILYFGATELSKYHETLYQQKLSSLEASSVQDTITLNRLLQAGITIDLRRHESGDGYFMILKGAKKAAQPVSTAEGLAVQIWP